ncbi:MAG: efflux RND transporter periplasmic adaptor subunit [Candidatus Omnitrophota bacterium]
MRRFLFIIVSLSIAGGIAWRLYTAVPAKSMMPQGKPPIAVEFDKAIQGDIDDVAEFTGTLAGESEVLVSPKISGRVEKIRVDLGDEVTAGQSLAVLDDVEARNAVEEANAKLSVARASLEECETNLTTVQSELERIRTLREKKVAAPSELENAEANVSTLLARKKVSQANIEQQDAALRAAQARLSYTQITAPIAGFVGKRFLDEGAMVSPSTPIVSLADMSTVKTVISVVERDYAKIKLGLKAALAVDAYPDKAFEGRVSRIAPVLNADTRTAETEIEIPNSDLLLKPGMFARVRIHFGTHRGVTLIPLRALVKRESQQGVFIPIDNNAKARFLPIAPGISSADVTEASGVEIGQVVIVMGQHLLNDGDGIVANASAGK